MSKISLFVMTEKGFEVTKRIASVVPNLISLVVIGKDSNIQNDFSNEIAKFCEEQSLKYVFRGEQESIDKETYIFAISWRWMINHPKNRLIVFHDSLLPKYRGFAPLVNMLINGEDAIGVSAIFGAFEYDKGEIIGQRSTKISYPIKISEAIRINNKNFLELAEEVATKISESSDLTSYPQNEEEASYSIWRDFEDYFVDWSKSAEEIKRVVDAVGSPYSGARTRTSDDGVVIIDDVEVVGDVNCELRHCGKVIFLEDGCPIIICGSGLLKVKEARIESDSAQKAFLPMKGFRFRFH